MRGKEEEEKKCDDDDDSNAADVKEEEEYGERCKWCEMWKRNKGKRG